ncbi:hypothetical protein G6F56_012456 [Rhizopus delemar]|nr:hypothetical protein G6F56_012456 [Rhizopus delemar]
MQLTLGSNNITNPNRAIPREQIVDSFNNYHQRYPGSIVRSPHRSQYSHILADIANTQATTFTNSVSETFQRRATQFFKFRLRELSQNAISNDNAKKLSLYIYSMKARDRNVFWPRSVTHSHETDAIVQQILDETDFGGPTPVTLATLSESPQD